jgi:hypothetical protein
VEKDERGEEAYYCRTRMGGTIARNVPMGNFTLEKRSRRSRTETRFALISFSKASPASSCKEPLVPSSSTA